MDDDREVIDRLERIERLDNAGAPAGELIVEVRELLRAAERVARSAADERLDETLARCRDALAAAGSSPPTADLPAIPALDRAG